MMTYRSLVRACRHAAPPLLAVVLNVGFASVSIPTLAVGSVGPTCVGDCDGSAAVTVAELAKGVSIALGTLPLEQCPREPGKRGQGDRGGVQRPSVGRYVNFAALPRLHAHRRAGEPLPHRLLTVSDGRFIV